MRRRSALGTDVLAYVFSHWKQPAVAASDYETRQRMFHDALASAPSAGFRGSFCASIFGTPWAAQGGLAYEDWYRVDDFAALGHLNEAAVSASRAAPHDAVAALSAGGAGAVYGLRLGEPLEAPRFAQWFAKPATLRYPQLFEDLTPRVRARRSALWMRQMVLGPSSEFCLHTIEPIELRAPYRPLTIELRAVWPAA